MSILQFSEVSAPLTYPFPPVLPSGAIGIWYPDLYTTSPRKVIPNQAAATAPDANLFGSGRRLLSTYFTAPSSTLTDNAVANPLGATEAATLVGTGNWFLWPVYDNTLPAGTYTVAVEAKRNTGTDQVFAFSPDFTTTKSPTKTATSAWQTFTYTFTLGSPSSIRNVVLCSIDGATNANLQISNFRLFAGSSDLGAPVFAGHLFPGKNGIDSSFVCSGGILDLTASQASGLIQFATAQNLASGFTVQAVVNKTTGSVYYEAMLSKVQDNAAWTAWFNYLSGEPMPSASSSPSAFNTTPVAASLGQKGGMWDFVGHGWHILTWRHNGTTDEAWLGNLPMFTRTVAMGSVTVADVLMNTFNNPTFSNGRKYGPIAMWNRGLSDTEVMAGYNFLKARAALSGITINDDTTDRVVIAEGDSITGGQFATSYPYQAGASLSPWTPGSVFGTGGATIANLVSRQPYVSRVLLNGVNSRKIIVTVLIGANDMTTWPGATDAIAMTNYAATVAAYCDTFRSQGFKVLVGTVLPIEGATTHNARRALYNSTVTSSWLGVHCDGIFDFAANATMGPDNSKALNPTLWFDTVHPTTAGHAVLAPIYAAAVNAI